jgi:signal peptidase I
MSDDDAFRGHEAAASPTVPPSDSAASGDHGEKTRADAARARRRRRARLEWAVILIVTVVGTFLVRTYVVQSYRIPSDSMEKTLHGCPSCNDDRILVNKLAYKLHGVHRGDIVVFKAPPTWAQRVGDEDVVKRVIGLPGDTVQCCDVAGNVMVNGKSLHESYVYVDGLDQKKQFPPQVVPKGELWVMGDHRNDSEDSRYLGPIPKSSVIGKAVMRVWPLSRIGGL